MNEETGTPTSTETEETEVVTEETAGEEADTEEEQVDWKAEAEKAKELADNYKKRAEKAEKKVKSAPEPSNGTLSPKDFIALQQAQITADDFDEVQDFANYRKISVAEALKSPTLKTILNERAEERNTAQAMNTKSPRGIAKTSGEDLLRKAEKTGEIPDTEEGLRALQEARLARRKNRS